MNAENSSPPSTNSPVQWTPISLYGWMTGLAAISKYLLGFFILVDILNGLNDFLHAPIGIKDNPPEPDAFVLFARLAFWPALIAFIVFTILKWISRDCEPMEVLLGFLLILGGALGMTLLAGKFLNHDFIPGTRYFWRVLVPSVFPYLFVVGFLIIDGLAARAQMLVHNSWKAKLAAVCFSLSTLFGVVAFIEYLATVILGRGPLTLGAVILFIGGLIAARTNPNEDEEELATKSDSADYR